MTYVAPVTEQRFVLETIADLEALSRLPVFDESVADLAAPILEEAGKLAAGVLAPLNRVGDSEGARFSNGAVSLPEGFRDAWRQYVDGGWNGLSADANHGGQGLPFVLACAVQEQFTSANMAFSLCMMLTQGAVEAVAAHGSDEQKQTYLTHLISGEWTGTMNLTEPQAGSDVGALKTKAEPAGDGSWLIEGQKIFITWGEHDLADNIVHLVLARTPGSPPGTKGISLFLVPKVLADGTRNDVHCVSIEHKLGIHASPTCTLSFGDDGRCVGYLIGAERAGMRAMFTMMNHARVNVGLQGVAIAERAYQAAVAYAAERVQGRTIIGYPDVRRMLMTIKASTEAIRALTYRTAAALDRARGESDPEARQRAQGLADLLTPVTKAYATDMGVELSSLALQVFGGMGYIEETGAAQHLRDARIAPIYEGTNGIQGLDLVGRKLPQDHWRPLFGEIRSFLEALPDHGDLGTIAAHLEEALEVLAKATHWMTRRQETTPEDAAAGATPYLRMFGTVMGGYLLARQAAAADDAPDGYDPAFLRAKIATALFFVEQIVPQSTALLWSSTRGASALYALSDDQFERAS